MASNIENLEQAIQLLKDVGNNGNDMLDEDFTNLLSCPYDNIYMAIHFIRLAIELFMSEPEPNGN